RASARLSFFLGAARDRDAALAAVAALRAGSGGAFDAARERAGERLAALGIAPARAALLEALAGAALASSPRLRAAADILARARGGREDRARLGIRAGRKLALLHAERPGGAGALREFLQAASYWRELGLPIDCVAI